MRITKYLLFTLMVIHFACDRSDESAPQIILLESPADINISTGESSLFSNGTSLYLLWQEHGEQTTKLKFARLEDGGWGPSSLIVSGSDWFVNWADFPVLSSLDDNSLITHHLKMNGEGTFAYGVNLMISDDGGEHWSPPFIPHETETETEHGFVSMISYNDGYMIAWLDGRNTTGGHGHGGSMQLRAAFIDRKGIVDQETLLDDRTCDCCQTDMTTDGTSIYLIYRDRSEDEIRDIKVIKYNGEEWSAPFTIHADNWNISGCPVNGPAIASSNQATGIAWYTGAPEVKGAYAAVSYDGGNKFSERIKLNTGQTDGRVDVAVKDDMAYVTWIESAGDSTFIMLGRIREQNLESTLRVAPTSTTRSAGFPRIQFHKKDMYITWRDVDRDIPTIQIARVTEY